LLRRLPIILAACDGKRSRRPGECRDVIRSYLYAIGPLSIVPFGILVLTLLLGVYACPWNCCRIRTAWYQATFRNRYPAVLFL